ncbi:MAG: type II CAAX prenyl endopeptidase Rce1 family protein [Pyrobaculum sp.]
MGWVSPLLRYVVSSMALAALVDVAFYGMLTSGDVVVRTAAFLAWGGLRMYSPTVAVILAAGIKAVREALRIDARAAVMYLTSPLVAYLALAFYYLIAASMGVAKPLPTSTLLVALVGGYIAAITINALFALGEEVGWRGFLQARLEAAGFSLTKAAVVTGVVWGFWHAPAILLIGHNYPESRPLGVFLFPLLTTAFSYPMAVVRRVSSSAFPCASLHGAINAVWGLAVAATDLPKEVGGLGLLAVVAWVFTSVIIYLLVHSVDSWRAKS